MYISISCKRVCFSNAILTHVALMYNNSSERKFSFNKLCYITWISLWGKYKFDYHKSIPE